jgi:hypothetical protein
MPSKSSGGIIGYRYYLGMHMGWCLSADKLIKFDVNDKTAWQGESTGGLIYVDAPNLFGGDDREGGIFGWLNVKMGRPSQGKNTYLVGQLGSLIPAFRGLCSTVWQRGCIGNNPYLKPWSMTWVRTQTDSYGEPIWYQAKADINSGDMNPAHIIYEALTDTDWGMGYPASAIDDANFRAVADTLHAEGHGLSMIWNQAGTIDAFIGNVINHINGFLYISPSTGLFKIKLVRNDYDTSTLDVFDESNIVALESFERRAWGETVNEINLVYRDRDDNKDKTITVQDIANIQFQGGVVSQTIQMPGIPNAALAQKVAFRELQAISSPLARVTLIVNRKAWNKAIGDVFKFSWAKLGIAAQVFRVMQIDTGLLTDGKIKIIAVEDVFGMPTATYVGTQSSGWVDPSQDPVDLTRQRVVEANYWDIQTKVKQADIATLTAGFGFLASIGSRESGVNYGYKLLTKVGANPYQNRGTFPSCPSAVIDGALAQEVTSTFSYSGSRDLALVELNTYGYIEDEIVEVTAIDTDLLTITVNRGVLDTVPVAHDAGKIIYFSENWSGRDPTEYTETDVVDAKLLEVTSQGPLAEGSASELSLTMANRYARPYAPGNFKINMLRYPASAAGNLALTWSHRDRTLQTAYLVDQTEGDIGPEASVTYTVRIYNTVGNVLKHTESALAGTSWTYTQAARIADFGGAGPHSVRIELEAVRSGVVSHQFHSVSLTVSDV